MAARRRRPASADDTDTAAAAAAAPSESGESGPAYDNAKSKNNKNKKKSKNRGGKCSLAPSPPRNTTTNTTTNNTTSLEMQHLPPLPLVMIVLVCSGLFWLASFRDLMATGKPVLDGVLGKWLWGGEDCDAALLEYTRSNRWYDESKGWKSGQGGLSAVMSATTDANDMGGFFVRKLAGAAGLAYHSMKLTPLLLHPSFRPEKRVKSSSGVSSQSVGASWDAGHFDPLLLLAFMGDAAVAAFYAIKFTELNNAGAGNLGRALLAAALLEMLAMGFYLATRLAAKTREAKRTNAKHTLNTTTALTDDAEELDERNRRPSYILLRTVLASSLPAAMIALRDLAFPGAILPIIPRDDVYLEWTGAFLHSPPPGTVEADEHGLEAPLLAGDKFAGQLAGLYVLLGCLVKFAAAAGWRKGKPTSYENGGTGERAGVVASKILWRASALGNAAVLLVVRIFTPAAQTASLDLRWHLMFVGYEFFILFMYGFF